MSTDGLLPAKLSYVTDGRHVPIVATCLACFIIACLGTFFDIKVLKNKCQERLTEIVFFLLLLRT
jgi:amino acid transporter